MSATHSPRLAVIITAIPCECIAVCEHLLDRNPENDPSGTVYERGAFQPATGQAWNVVVVEAGAGNIPAALEAQKAISRYRPDVAIFVGIAGGLKDVRLGDVVAATKVYGYEFGRAEREFRTRPALQVSSYRLIQRAMAERRREEWCNRIRGRVAGSRAKAWVGPIAAGEKVIASTCSESYQLLKAAYGDALAVEMEGYGFLSAAHSNPQVEALVIRGISDLLDDKSTADSRDSQEMAARAASAFCFEVLAHLDVRTGRAGETVRHSGDGVTEEFRSDPVIDRFIRGVKLAEWEAAADSALEVIKMTDSFGNNDVSKVSLSTKTVARRTIGFGEPSIPSNAA
jgi:nucleoside phosphorylase